MYIYDGLCDSVCVIACVCVMVFVCKCDGVCV